MCIISEKQRSILKKVFLSPKHNSLEKNYKKMVFSWIVASSCAVELHRRFTGVYLFHPQVNAATSLKVARYLTQVSAITNQRLGS